MFIGKTDTKLRIALVAEIGNNHEGSVQLADKMVEQAFRSGADAVKLQTLVPTEFVSPLDTERLEQMRKFALSHGDTRTLLKKWTSRGYHLFSTPLDMQSLAFLVPLVRTIKIASGDITFLPLIESAASSGKDLILSTGAANLEEVTLALEVIAGASAKLNSRPKVAILHCVSTYPAEASSLNLSSIRALQQNWPDATIGYSDHSIGLRAPVVAATFGARIIEKHFTLDKEQMGFRDHALSADPNDLQQLRRDLDDVEEMIGQGVKAPSQAELGIVSDIRRSLTLRKDLSTGARISAADVVCMRPGIGLPPSELSQIIGRRLRVAKVAGEVLYKQDLE